MCQFEFSINKLSITFINEYFYRIKTPQQYKIIPLSSKNIKLKISLY